MSWEHPERLSWDAVGIDRIYGGALGTLTAGTFGSCLGEATDGSWDAFAPLAPGEARFYLVAPDGGGLGLGSCAERALSGGCE